MAIKHVNTQHTTHKLHIDQWLKTVPVLPRARGYYKSTAESNNIELQAVILHTWQRSLGITPLP